MLGRAKVLFAAIIVYRTHNMTEVCTRFVRRVAGTVVLLGVLLGWAVNDWFYLIDVFAGVNLIQSTVTGICPPRRACRWWIGDGASS